MRVGECMYCGKNPAEGYASVYKDGVEKWYCHGDKGPTCYEKIQSEAYERRIQLSPEQVKAFSAWMKQKRSEKPH